MVSFSMFHRVMICSALYIKNKNVAFLGVKIKIISRTCFDETEIVPHEFSIGLYSIGTRIFNRCTIFTRCSSHKDLSTFIISILSNSATWIVPIKGIDRFHWGNMAYVPTYQKQMGKGNRLTRVSVFSFVLLVHKCCTQELEWSQS